MRPVAVSGTCEMYIDELQDINPDFLPVLSAAVRPQYRLWLYQHYGYGEKRRMMRWGQEFEESSQGHWLREVSSFAEKYNIAAQQEQLFKNDR